MTCAGSGAAMTGMTGRSPAASAEAQTSTQRSRQGAGMQHQLRHLSRWLYAERSGQLFVQAQRPQMERTAGDGFRANYSCQLWHRRAIGRSRRRKPALQRQIKNFLLTIAISRGVPMLLGGDEFRRTQGGNNNAYCQDNEISWLDWSLLRQNSEVFRFARGMLAFRRAHTVLRKEAFYAGEEVSWFNPEGKYPEWSDASQRGLACLIRGQGAPDLFMMFNAGNEFVTFAVPPLPGDRAWYIATDTAQPTPEGFYRRGEETALSSPTSYGVQSSSSVVLVSR